MLFLTRWFGVTGSDAERDLGAERDETRQIVERVLVLQANAAASDRRELGRGTHAKGLVARAEFEVFDLTLGRDPALAARLARGIFARPGIYPATVRFANSDPHVNSDFKPDVRALSIAVDLTCGGTTVPTSGVQRQDFSLQSAPTLPINDARAFLATMQLMTAASPAKGLRSLSLRDKLRVVRTLVLARLQSHPPNKPYQQLRYWSTVPFRHGSNDVIKQSATPSPGNSYHPLEKANSDALRDELVRHLDQDSNMSSFDFGLQFLDTGQMTYWGKRRDANFWIENASVKWNEAQAPHHTVARLTLMTKSQLTPPLGDATYIDVTGNASPDSAPLGSINRARWPAEVASRQVRMSAAAGHEVSPPPHSGSPAHS